MNRRQLWRYIRRAWITLGLSATAVFIGWSLIAYRASDVALAAIESDTVVTVRQADGIVSFLPAQPRAPKGAALIFFPGALVNPAAYAPLLRAAAIEGFAAHLIELPRRGAFGGADDPEVERRLDRLLALQDTPRQWLAAGHSRGAVVASRIASQRRPGFAGLILIGTTHPRDVDLSTLTVPVTKVVSTHDGLARRGAVEANRALLPTSTRWIWIDGGNHSQFGWYGFQPGDRWATISPESQRDTMIRATLDALRAAAPPAQVDAPALAGFRG